MGLSRRFFRSCRPSSFLVLFLFCFVWPCHASRDDDEEQETVVLQLKWMHQFQFAGFYAAVAKGFYRDAGLDVEILEMPPGGDYVEEVFAGRADYGVGNSSVLQRWLDGAPLVALAAIFQHSPYVLLTLQESGIETPSQMAGKRFLVSESARPLTEAMLVAEGVELGDFEYVPSEQWSLDALKQGRCDVFGAYATNELFRLNEQGLALNVISPRSYGIDFYEDIIFTSLGTLQEHPARTKRFVQASLKGWRYAVDHPHEVVELLVSTWGSNKDRKLLLQEAEAMREALLPELVDLGHMNTGRWQRMAELLGCATTTADDGRQALELLRVGGFDVVLMDIQMPVLDGIEATRRIKEGRSRRARGRHTHYRPDRFRHGRRQGEVSG